LVALDLNALRKKERKNMWIIGRRGLGRRSGSKGI